MAHRNTTPNSNLSLLLAVNHLLSLLTFQLVEQLVRKMLRSIRHRAIYRILVLVALKFENSRISKTRSSITSSLNRMKPMTRQIWPSIVCVYIEIANGVLLGSGTSSMYSYSVNLWTTCMPNEVKGTTQHSSIGIVFSAEFKWLSLAFDDQRRPVHTLPLANR